MSAKGLAECERHCPNIFSTAKHDVCVLLSDHSDGVVEKLPEQLESFWIILISCNNVDAAKHSAAPNDKATTLERLDFHDTSSIYSINTSCS
jgi:hypothetical protein